jgi:hypothetical protein
MSGGCGSPNPSRATVVQEPLGHSDLSMTLRNTKVLPELAKAVPRRVEDILRQTGRYAVASTRNAFPGALPATELNGDGRRVLWSSGPGTVDGLHRTLKRARDLHGRINSVASCRLAYR